MTGKTNAWHLGDRRSRPAPLAKGAVAEQESSLSRMEKREGPTPCVPKRIHKFNVGLCVAQMDRHGSKSYEHQSGVCTKSVRRRF
jgi:hypothetical protein